MNNYINYQKNHISVIWIGTITEKVADTDICINLLMYTKWCLQIYRTCIAMLLLLYQCYRLTVEGCFSWNGVFWHTAVHIMHASWIFCPPSCLFSFHWLDSFLSVANQVNCNKIIWLKGCFSYCYLSQQAGSQPISDGRAPLLLKYTQKKAAHIHVRHYQRKLWKVYAHKTYG